MEQIKQIQANLKTDFYIFDEITNVLSHNDENKFAQIQCLIEKLRYESVEKSLCKIKQDFLKSFPSDCVKLSKIECDINKLRKQHFSISTVLNQNFFELKQNIKIDVIKTNLLETKNYEFPLRNIVQWDKCFKAIKNERIPVILGEQNEKVYISDLVKMPHLLVAGQTGSGKSVFLNTLITTILYVKHPNDCKLILIDPKRVEFSLYRKVPHLFNQVVTETNEIEGLLVNLIEEMEKRFKELELLEVRSLESYNEKAKNKKPYIVVVIDEMADLIMSSSNNIENKIIKLIQLSRAVGIHFVMATQRPIVKVITGNIKGNMPTRISFKVSSIQDSRIILDKPGAEQLKGNGDMLFSENGKLTNCQGIYINEEQIKKIVNFIK
jgi:S-DNA-T family DNA segregation ATPase FtsK/SpoIIIE